MADFDKLWNYGDPAATEQHFRELLPQAEASSDTDHFAQLVTQIARCQSLQSKFDDAHATLDRVDGILASDATGSARVRYYLERGRTYNSSTQQAKALPLFHQAFQLADALGEHRYAVDALHMIAIAERDPSVQLEWNLKAIGYAERTNEHGWLFALYNNIGESYLALQQYEQAYEYFSRLASLQKERKGAEDHYTVKDKAKAARLAGRAEESLDLMLRVLDKLLSEKTDDGYIRQEYAEALYALGDTNGAKPHFAKAYELLSNDSWVVQYETQNLERMRLLSV